MVQPDAAEDTAPDGPQADENPQPEVVAPEGGNDASESFPREYVEKLRKESAGYRDKARQAEKDADDANALTEGLMRRLHTTLVSATGLLADPADLEFSPEHLMDEDALSEAIDQLIAEKPHLKARKVAGDVGQGNRGHAAEFSLLDVLKSRA